MKILEADREALYEILKTLFDGQNVQPITIEVGVLKGENAQQINKICKPQALYLIDSWSANAFKDYHENNKHRDWVDDLNKYESYFGGDITNQKTFDRLHDSVLSKFAKKKNVTVIRKESHEGAKELQSLGVSGVNHAYIDASHQFETVLDDLISYEPLLDSNLGCFQLNDCCYSEMGNAQNLGVLEAVVRFCKMKNFAPVALVNRHWTDLIIAPNGSPIIGLIDEIIENSDMPFVEVPNSLLGNLSVTGSRRGNISFCK